MLIIAHKKEETIVIDDNIRITVLEIRRNRVRLGIIAPKNVKIVTRDQTASDRFRTLFRDESEKK